MEYYKESIDRDVRLVFDDLEQAYNNAKFIIDHIDLNECLQEVTEHAECLQGNLQNIASNGYAMIHTDISELREYSNMLNGESDG